MDYILKLININKSFFTVSVLEDVHLNLEKGSILGLVGENGAGKSTLMNILGGVLDSDSGEMYFEGKKYKPHNPIDALNKGIAFIHQEISLFSNLTIKENIFIESMPKRRIIKTIDYKHMKNVANQALKRLGVSINPDWIVSELTIGQRQIVQIAKALIKNTKIIIFDEPTTSLSNTEKEKLFKIIRDLSNDGVSIIYISHILDDVFNLCDEIVVLRNGRIMGQDETTNLTKEKVVKMMVGLELSNLFPYIEKNPSETVYRVEKLYYKNKFRNISFKLRKGEIVGLFGLMGAGRSELANALFGIIKIDSGKICIEDKEITRPRPAFCIKKGIAFITENRREEGLMMRKSVKDNLIMVCLPELKGKLGKLNWKKENNKSDRIIGELGIKTYDKIEQMVEELSGGNQQKVVIGKWLLMNPKILLLDEPTKGVDVGSKYEIYNYINKIALAGAAVLIISSEMEELIGICDKIIVMSKGEIAGKLERKEFNQEVLLKLAIGKGSN
jgi:ribose transport system ATP-binding protein